MLLAESTRFLSLLLFFFFKALYQREFDDFMKAFFFIKQFSRWRTERFFNSFRVNKNGVKFEKITSLTGMGAFTHFFPIFVALSSHI